MAIDKDKVWNKGNNVAGESDSYKYELTTDDVTPAKLYKSSRENTPMAWEVDHIFPQKILEKLGVPQDMIDHIDNLRPLHHSNNEAKGTQFPNYQKTVCWDEARKENVSCNQSVRIADETIERLNNLYKEYLGGYTLEQIAEAYNRK